jgi:hypothetical protein
MGGKVFSSSFNRGLISRMYEEQKVKHPKEEIIQSINGQMN